MAFGRGEFSAFYGQTTENAPILRERRRWLEDDPNKYLAVLPDAKELLRETIALALEHKTVHPSISIPTAADEGARFLGENWEPDFLLLKRMRLFPFVLGIGREDRPSDHPDSRSGPSFERECRSPDTDFFGEG